MNATKLWLVVAGMCLLVGGPAAFGVAQARPSEPAAHVATTVILYPTADAYVNQAAPGTNYNSAALWPVARNAADQERYTLLQFDLAGIPDGSWIDSAELRLWLETASGPPEVSIGAARVSIAWNEATVTWNSRPPDQCCWAQVDVGQPTSDYQVWDIRTLVNNWVNGNFQNRGIALHGPASGEYERLFAATGGRRPRLVVQFVPPTPTATPSPTASATGTGVPTMTPTASPLASATASPSTTATATTSATTTATATPSATPTVMASATATHTALPTSTMTPPATTTVTPSASPAVTGTATVAPTSVGTMTHTPTPATTGTATTPATATGTVPPTPSASDTPTTAASATPAVTASATASAGPSRTPDAHTGRIEGLVWEDRDHDGVTGPGETRLPGVRLDLTGPGGTRVAVSDGSGHFAFEALTPADYRVDVAEPSLPPGFVLVSGREPWTGHVGPGASVRLDFGYAALVVVGRVWLPWTGVP